MVMSVVVFIPAIYFGHKMFGLHGIWAAFLFLLGVRGGTLWLRLDRVYEKTAA